MSRRKQQWNKARTTNVTNPPARNMAELFGGTLAGGIPIKASVMNLTPLDFKVSGATEALATTELMRVVSDEFTRLGVHQHPVNVEMEIGGTKIRRKLLVVFDESYTCSAMWPIDTVFASAGMLRHVEDSAPETEAHPDGCLEDEAPTEAEGSAKKAKRLFTDVQHVDPRTRTPHDEKHSPLRIKYDEDDPRKDRTLQFITELHGHTTFSDDTLYFRTTWLDAYKLLTAVQRRNLGVYRTHNKDGAPVMSGYDLIRAGLLNEAGEVTIHLTPDEEPPSTHEDLKAAVLALAPHRGTPEFVMLSVKSPSIDTVLPVLQRYSTHEPTGIGHTEPDTYITRFRCTDLPGLTAALLHEFPQFHLRWIDKVWTSLKTSIPVIARFGESWTTDFAPLWFKDEHDGDRYSDGDTVLVWSRIGHEFLTGDTLVKVGSPDSEYSYGLGATVMNGEVDTDAVDAAIASAAQEGKQYSTVLDGAF